MKRAIIITAFSLVAILVLGAGFVMLRQQGQARIAQARHERILRAVDKIKRGGHSVSLSDSKMLPALAQDSGCVTNVTDITFWADVTPEDAEHLASLKNVKSMFFYCTDPTHVLQHSQGLPLEEIIFELVTLTPEQIDALGEIPSLTRVEFQGQRISQDELKALRMLPDRIELDFDYCEIEEPAPQPVGQ